MTGVIQPLFPSTPLPYGSGALLPPDPLPYAAGALLPSDPLPYAAGALPPATEPGRHRASARRAVPASAPAVPPRRRVSAFAPIRRGGSGRHRLQQAARHRPGIVVTGLLAAATALAAGPLRPGPPVPAATSSAHDPGGAQRCVPGAAPQSPPHPPGR